MSNSRVATPPCMTTSLGTDNRPSTVHPQTNHLLDGHILPWFPVNGGGLRSHAFGRNVLEIGQIKKHKTFNDQ